MLNDEPKITEQRTPLLRIFDQILGVPVQGLYIHRGRSELKVGAGRIPWKSEVVMDESPALMRVVTDRDDVRRDGCGAGDAEVGPLGRVADAGQDRGARELFLAYPDPMSSLWNRNTLSHFYPHPSKIIH